MKGKIIKKVFLYVTIYCYVEDENGIIQKRPIGQVMIETNDPDTAVLSVSGAPHGKWIHAEALIEKKDQRFMED